VTYKGKEQKKINAELMYKLSFLGLQQKYQTLPEWQCHLCFLGK
jgi:hypothetical protein